MVGIFPHRGACLRLIGNGATVSGTVTVSANATDNGGMAAVQFRMDGANLGNPVTGPGPGYSYSWDTTAAANGSHTLAAVASDAAGNTTTVSISVTVSNVIAPPVISAVSANPTASGATITWTSSTPSDSQVAYGATSAYGSVSPLNSTLVTSHSVTLTALTASTTYHYQVRSRDSQGNLAIFTTAAPAGPQPLLLIHADASELSGLTNGSVVTPSVAPSGFTGTVVDNGSGSVNFAPAQVGNGVYFLNCCANTDNLDLRPTGPRLPTLIWGRMTISPPGTMSLTMSLTNLR